MNTLKRLSGSILTLFCVIIRLALAISFVVYLLAVAIITLSVIAPLIFGLAVYSFTNKLDGIAADLYQKRVAWIEFNPENSDTNTD